MGLLDAIDRVLGTRIGLLVSDPRAAINALESDARVFNQASLLATQAERNAARGLPVSPEQLAAKQYIDRKNEDLAMGFAGNIKTVGKTPYELAQEVAQKNAVEMLGLPPNNTAMDRARAMGFGNDVYHGTTKSFNEFDMSKLGASGADALEGVFTVTNPKVANEFIWSKGSNEGGNVMPLMLRTFDPVKSLTVLNGATGSDAAKILKQAKRAGYDRVDFPTNMLGSQGTTQVVFDPSRIRSRFAAFDPARVNEADLLAAGIPLGFLADTNVEMPKKKEKKK